MPLVSPLYESPLSVSTTAAQLFYVSAAAVESTPFVLVLSGASAVVDTIAAADVAVAENQLIGVSRWDRGVQLSTTRERENLNVTGDRTEKGEKRENSETVLLDQYNMAAVATMTSCKSLSKRK